MANNTLIQLPFSATGVKPAQWYLTSTEDYDTLTGPGYITSVASAGIELSKNDVIFAQYDNASLFGMFVVTEAEGVFTLELYVPGDNSFNYQRTMFVAKGGSDLSAGDQIGFPKLTIQSAIDALNMTELNKGVVIVLDSGEYDESLVLPFNISIFAPNAVLTASSGDLITINDSGVSTAATIQAKEMSADVGYSINLLGAQSSLFLKCGNLTGDMYLEGSLLDGVIAQVDSNVELTATAVFGPKVVNAIALNITPAGGSIVLGQVQVVDGSDSRTNFYGNMVAIDKLFYQTHPIAETAGRTLEDADNNGRIVYNNASADDFIMPTATSSGLAIGSNVEFTQLGLGAARFVADAGVTIVSAAGSTVETNGAGASAKAWLYTDDIWVISGDVAAVGP